jgi:hypothetical protein
MDTIIPSTKEKKNMPSLNVLIMSSYPILNQQWVETFMEWDGYQKFNIVNVRNGEELHVVEDTVNIFLVSLQDGKGEADEDAGVWSKQKFDAVRNVKIDVVGIDEIHLGVETERTDALLDRIDYKYLIGMSATPGRNLSYGRFEIENTHMWDLVDEMQMKKSGHAAYQRFEQIHFICPTVNAESIKELASVYNKDEGFTFKKFLSVNENGFFEYEQAVEHGLKMIFGIGAFQKNENSLIRKNCKGVLITVENSKCVEALRDKLVKMVGKKYNVYWTTSQENDVTALYNKVHNDWIPTEEKGSIVIVVDQLKTGVTLPWCDAVIFMNDCKSPSEWIQTAFRCQSPRKTSDDRYGKGVYVYDMNINRVLHCVHRMADLRQATNKGSQYLEVIREVLDCCPIYTSDDGISFDQIDVQRFIDMKRKMTFEGYYENIFGNTIVGMLINDEDAEFLNNLNITGRSSGKSTDDMHTNDAHTNGNNETVQRRGDKNGKKQAKVMSPEDKARILANSMMKELLMVCPTSVMNIEDMIKFLEESV